MLSEPSVDTLNRRHGVKYSHHVVTDLYSELVGLVVWLRKNAGSFSFRLNLSTSNVAKQRRSVVIHGGRGTAIVIIKVMCAGV